LLIETGELIRVFRVFHSFSEFSEGLLKASPSVCVPWGGWILSWQALSAAK
jgi:hypothetical protein